MWSDTITEGSMRPGGTDVEEGRGDVLVDAEHCDELGHAGRHCVEEEKVSGTLEV